MPDNNIKQLITTGIAYDDAIALRRISMTLHRWHELECGSGDENADYHIERDNDDKPHLVVYYHRRQGPANHTYKRRVPDREKGALKRLDKIMARYPDLTPYVQGDPRGCALYILRPNDVPEGADAGAYYPRGVAVY